ncbi:MAG: BlaI/MecI/CopY family transcriptional regulator [Myxococcota bacterium]
MDPVDALGPLESRVMLALWAAGTGTAREVCAALGEEWAYTTIMTTLDRLHKKGVLLREKEGLAWRYRTAVERDAFERAQVDALAARLLGERRDLGLAALVDAADAATLERLAELIQARRRK